MSNDSKRVNKQINSDEVRLIDSEGENIGVVETDKAIKKAKEKDLDLVEVQPNAQPPVAKFLDYDKYQYEQEKKRKKQKKKNKKVGQLKNIRFKFQTSENDLKTKARKVDEFLEKQYKVKVQIMLRGRENAHKDLAKEKIETFLDMLEEDYKFEKEPEDHPVGFEFMIRKDT